MGFYRGFRHRWFKWLILFLYAGCGILLMVSCSFQKESLEGQREKVDYEIAGSDAVSDDFLEAAETKKYNKFYMSYTDGEDVWIAIGYGERQTSGYSILVEDIYRSGGKICVRTMLVGPEKKDRAPAVKTYPYIILKVKGGGTVVYE